MKTAEDFVYSNMFKTQCEFNNLIILCLNNLKCVLRLHLNVVIFWNHKIKENVEFDFGTLLYIEIKWNTHIVSFVTTNRHKNNVIIIQ